MKMKESQFSWIGTADNLGKLKAMNDSSAAEEAVTGAEALSQSISSAHSLKG
jgi:hypothetical protein